MVKRKSKKRLVQLEDIKVEKRSISKIKEEGKTVSVEPPFTDEKIILSKSTDIVDLEPLDEEPLIELDRYFIVKGFAYIRIVQNTRTYAKSYIVVEPELSEDEKKLFKFIMETLLKVLAISSETLEEDKTQYLQQIIKKILQDYNITIDDTSWRKILYYVRRDFLGYGKIDVLMRDDMIEDISCNGHDLPLYIYHREHESLDTNLNYTENELNLFVIRLAQLCDTHISIAHPLLDTTLPDGSRLQATLKREVTTRGSTFTIRKFKEVSFTPAELVQLGTFSSAMMAYLWLLVEYKVSIMFAGSTASGKTTTLNAVSLFIPPQQKIVSIEETREIALYHKNWIPSITREGQEVVDGKMIGDVDMYKLLKTSLRQRPDYIIVGEIRGREAFVLFQAMATGHTTFSTMHADSIDALVDRFIHKPIDIPPILLNSLGAVVIQVLTRVGRDPVRRCTQIVEIIGFDDATKRPITKNVYKWDPQIDYFEAQESDLIEKIMTRYNMTKEQIRIDLKRRTEILEWLNKNKIWKLEDLTQIFQEYYNNPDRLLARMEVKTEKDLDTETQVIALTEKKPIIKKIELEGK